MATFTLMTIPGTTTKKFLAVGHWLEILQGQLAPPVLLDRQGDRLAQRVRQVQQALQDQVDQAGLQEVRGLQVQPGQVAGLLDNRGRVGLQGQVGRQDQRGQQARPGLQARVEVQDRPVVQVHLVHREHARDV